MFTKKINFDLFNFSCKSKVKIKDLERVLNYEKDLINSFSKKFKNNFKSSYISKLRKKYKFINVIGMGGSTMGSKAIQSFLGERIKLRLNFIDNLQNRKNIPKRKSLNIVISKSGNTLETISNSNIFLSKYSKNIFITENSNNYLNRLAYKLGSDIIEHRNYIGGRYSVLSEVGMLPAQFMGLKDHNFRQLNSLMRNKTFVKKLIKNVNQTLTLVKKKKFNSIIINYDEQSEDLFKWYQQLIAESLGKNGNGILPIISTMPKDNHSVMQLYLDGPKNSFYTFFYVHEKKSLKVNRKYLLSTYDYLKNKNIDEIKYAQKIATERVFRKKNIPFRSFEIKDRSEQTLGELFCFFVLESILVGKAMKINPFDQPAVELIKKETKKKLI